MLKWLFGPLPDWFQQQHPVQRYALQPYAASNSRSARIVRITFSVLLLSALVIAGYTVASHVMNNPPAGLHIAEVVFRILYYPLIALQTITWVLALAMSINVLDAERRRQTWDNLRATSTGADMVVRVGWLAVLHRLRGLWLVMTAARLILLIGVLYRLMSHRGDYLAYLTATVQPDVPLGIALFLLVSLLVAAFILPFMLLGLSTALGLWLSALFRPRAVTAIFQFILTAFYVALALILFLIVQSQAIHDMPPAQNFGLLTGYSLLVDWGALWLDLGSTGDIWAQIPYSVLMGPILLLAVLLLAWLIDRLLKAAVHHAEIRD
ncbi:MAG: hypothetical protein KC708_20625 [Anaerolineae bacterium]|nr:hypothetical protein [Anaerolineae bacterium]